MVKEFLGLIKSAPHTNKRKVLVEKLENTLVDLNGISLTAVNMGIEALSDKKNMFKDNTEIAVKADYRRLKVKNDKDFLIKVKAILNKIDKNSNTIVKLANSTLPTIIMDKALTAKQTAVLKLISDITILTDFSLDIVYLLISSKRGDKTHFGKKTLSDMMFNVIEFGEVISVLDTDFTKYLKEINMVSEDIMHINDSNTSLLERTLGNSGKLLDTPNVNGFLGNPIYRFRIFLKDREHKANEVRKDKLRLLQLIITELKAEQAEEYNATRDEQIAYYEEKVSQLEYEISTYEDN